MAMGMEDVYNPADETVTADYFDAIGSITGNEQSWTAFRMALITTTAAATIRLLKKLRDADINLALANAKLGVGYKDALCEYLTPRHAAPFQFILPPDHSGALAAGRRTGFAPASAMSQKKFESQQQRPPLGRELGPGELSKIALPEHLFQKVKWSQQNPMPCRGKDSTEIVADIVWQWIFTKYGTIHVDMAFCQRMEQLLNGRWPNLAPWGTKERSWSKIIQNRFSNVRCSNLEENDRRYSSLRIIPEVDLSSPAKKLVGEGFGNLQVKQEARSMLELSPSANVQPSTPASGAAGDCATAIGVPLMGGCTF